MTDWHKYPDETPPENEKWYEVIAENITVYKPIELPFASSHQYTTRAYWWGMWYCFLDNVIFWREEKHD